MQDTTIKLTDDIGLHLKTAQAAFGEIKGRLTGHDRTALTKGQQAVTSAQMTQAALAVEVSEPSPVPGPPSAVVYVPAGGNLQAALDQARGRTVVEIEAGVRYPGPYVLPQHGSAEFATLRTRGQARVGRTQRADAPGLGQIMSSAGGVPPLRALPGAHHWALEDVTLMQDVGQTWSILELGHGEEKSWDAVPHHFIVDRCALTLSDKVPVRRGITLNAFDVIIRDTAIWNVKEEGFDCQAIGGRIGGRHRIENCELEASGINVLFGGAPAYIPGAMVRDVTLDRSLLTKNRAWRKDTPAWDGSNWQVKNLFEIKAGERIYVTNTVMEHCWRHAQDGCAVLLTVRSEGTAMPWATIRDIRFENVRITGVGNGFQFLHADEADTSLPARDFLFRNVYLEASVAQGGSGRIMEGSPIENLVLDNVVGITDGTSAYYFRSDHPSVTGFQVRRSAYMQNTYGFWTEGKPFAQMFPGAAWNDVTVGSDRPPDHPLPAPSTVIPVAEYVTRYKKTL